MKRLLISIILCIVLTLTATAQTLGTTLDTINLRAQAGFGDNILTQIPIDSPVTIIGRNDDGAWLLVNYDGIEGWVSSTYIDWDNVELLDFPATSGSIQAPATTSNDTVVTSGAGFPVQTVTRLNVRSEPSVTATILTTLRIGQQVEATGRSRDGAWVAVDTGVVQGWVSGAYLSSNTDLMALPVTSDLFNAPVPIQPTEPAVSEIITLDDGEYRFTGPAVGNTTSYDVEITLHWNSTANLDLRVIGPDGDLITAGSPPSATGGFFQQATGANEICFESEGAPLEVITWRLGTAPSGLYQIIVEHVNSCNAAAEEDTLFWVSFKNDGPEERFWVEYIEPGDVFNFSFVRP